MAITKDMTVEAAFPEAPYMVSRLQLRGVRTLGDLRHLKLAEWWRLGRAFFYTLARKAIAADVMPHGMNDAEEVYRILRHSFSGMLNRAGQEHLASVLAGAGVTSLVLVTRLTKRDLLDINGVEPADVQIVINVLGRRNLRLAQR